MKLSHQVLLFNSFNYIIFLDIKRPIGLVWQGGDYWLPIRAMTSSLRGNTYRQKNHETRHYIWKNTILRLRLIPNLFLDSGIKDFYNSMITFYF
jgi:hypothetical protein